MWSLSSCRPGDTELIILGVAKDLARDEDFSPRFGMTAAESGMTAGESGMAMGGFRMTIKGYRIRKRGN